jgi:hypothetical protein
MPSARANPAIAAVPTSTLRAIRFRRKPLSIGLSIVVLVDRSAVQRRGQRQNRGMTASGATAQQRAVRRRTVAVRFRTVFGSRASRGLRWERVAHSRAPH